MNILFLLHSLIMLDDLLLLLSDRITALEALLEDHSDWNIDLKPAEPHPLNPANMKEYLAACDEEIRDSMRIVLQQIKHVSYDEFLSIIQKNVDKLLSYRSIPKRWFFFSTYICKSPTWVAMLIMRYISKHHRSTGLEMFFINSLNDNRIEPSDLVVFADDCAYSGVELKSVLLTAFFNCSKQELPQILIFLPYSSETALTLLKTTIQQKFITKVPAFRWCPLIEIFSTIPDEILTKDSKLAISNYFPNISCNLIGTHMVYFDHKRADAKSIPYPIFMGMIPCLHNQTVLQQSLGELNEKIKYIEFIDNLNSKHDIEPPYKSAQFEAAFQDIWKNMSNYSWK